MCRREVKLYFSEITDRKKTMTTTTSTVAITYLTDLHSKCFFPSSSSSLLRLSIALRLEFFYLDLVGWNRRKERLHRGFFSMCHSEREAEESESCKHFLFLTHACTRLIFTCSSERTWTSYFFSSPLSNIFVCSNDS